MLQAEADEEIKQATPANVPGIDFTITNEVELGEGAESVKFADNLAAIRTLKTLEQEGRRATPQPSEFLADEVAAALFVGGRLPTPFGPSQDVSGITTLVVVHLGVVHFPDPGADGVQEPTVVADHQHGDTALLQFAQVLGQPVHRLHVEVVGRLIEHQQVVAAGQQSGQGGPPPLAARQI